MLNQALRLLDPEIILMIGFYICDLHRQLERLHQEQIDQHRGELFTVYRGQRLSMDDFAKLSKSIGGLLSFNSFLSTSSEKDVPLMRAISATDEPDIYGILFVITVDPKLHSTVFANIEKISYFSIEAEILFSMHTVFRIRHVINLKQHDRLFEVRLTLTNDDDRQTANSN